MLLIDQEDLEARGIDCQGVTQFIFLDKCFQKGPTFANNERENAIASCRKILDEGSMSLIVNYQSHFTLWVETHTPIAPHTAVQAEESQMGDVSDSDPSDPSEKSDQAEPNWNYKQIITKLNEPVDMRAVMAKLNEPISLKSIFAKTKNSSS
ncbi:MAG: hypothetical protein HC851_16105 [Acaryochloris sp. RU_4_1]|nr:hypothetical protein [Acaryochloris sp. RU_4_1]NJR54721.1 hypothetical protein [Acaryochloris sp. CRU_2_0]